MIGVVSTIIFTVLVLLSSHITTYFMAAFEEPSYSYSYYSSYYFTSPFDIAQDLVRAALRILRDGDSVGILDDSMLSKLTTPVGPVSPPVPRPPPGIIKRFVRRFVLGLPIVGAGSLVQMLFSVPFLGPVHWLARYRGNRGRRGNTRDVAAIVIILLLVMGAARSTYIISYFRNKSSLMHMHLRNRALYKVYELTQRVTKRILLRAEDAILEVNSV